MRQLHTADSALRGRARPLTVRSTATTLAVVARRPVGLKILKNSSNAHNDVDRRCCEARTLHTCTHTRQVRLVEYKIKKLYLASVKH